MTTPEYTQQQLAQDAALTDADMVQINRRRGDHNRLGFAYQLGFVRLFNRLPPQEAFEVVDELLIYISIQVELAPSLITDYQQRRQTIAEHQQLIMAYLRLRRFGEQDMAMLQQFIFEQACRLEQTVALQVRVKDFLRAQRILQPAPWTVNRLIMEQRQQARELIYTRVTHSLTNETMTALDQLLDIESGKRKSPLQRLKANPRNASPEAMQALLDKLQAIETTGVLQVDVSWLNGNYQRALFHYVSKCSVDRLRAVTQPRRSAVLVCFLWQCYRDAIDQAVDMYDKIMTWVHTQAENDVDDYMRKQRKSIQQSLATFKQIGEVILDQAVADDAVRKRLFQRISREDLQAQIKALDEWVSGKKSHQLHGVIRRHAHLRKFAPAFLRALNFVETLEGSSSTLPALQLLNDLNANNKRKLPGDAPTAFAANRWQPLLHDDQGELQKPAWECALLSQLQEEIRAGNLFVQHSKRFGRFDDFFITDEQWAPLREVFFERAKFPHDPREIPAYLRQRLNTAYDQFLATADRNPYANADDKGWHFAADPTEKLSAAEQVQLDQLKDWLGQHMRWIRLPDLLIEVDNELGFTQHFMSASQRQTRSADEVCTILAAIMAQGCNIGLSTMAQLVQGISYRQLKRVNDWQMTEEVQRAVLSQLVGAISTLETSLRWGSGKTSASDGQRFALPRKVLQRSYSPRIRDFALEFYTFLADNYAPYYATPIECSDRDAAFLLDGVLYNETDLDLEEHYVDTHGFTEINFAAFAMLGRRFCPRLRGLHKQRIYRIDTERDYGALAHLLKRSEQTLNPERIAEQWDRMGQFYASLELGHTTASVALRRLVGFSAKNQFYRANRDLGRIFKTEFILQYLSQPPLRQRIRRGLLKVDQLHALARDVYYGRRGRLNARELHEQMTSCSCLTLILACIIYWQAKEIDRVLNECNPQGYGINLDLLEHVSPIEWENVVLYGEYVLNRELVRRIWTP